MSLVSRSSHLPHVVAAQLVRLILSPEHPKEQGMLCANGFRDTTRIASGSPEMWRDIALANRQEPVPRAGVVHAGPAGLSGGRLDAGTPEAVASFFEQARARRERWSKRTGPCRRSKDSRMSLPDLIEIVPARQAGAGGDHRAGLEEHHEPGVDPGGAGRGRNDFARRALERGHASDGRVPAGTRVHGERGARIPRKPCNRTHHGLWQGRRGAAGRARRSSRWNSLWAMPAPPRGFWRHWSASAKAFIVFTVCRGCTSARRPPLFQALREMGYRIDSPNDKLPALIYGAGPRAAKCRVSIEESSQFASALLLCAEAGEWQVSVSGENAGGVALCGDDLEADRRLSARWRTGPGRAGCVERQLLLGRRLPALLLGTLAVGENSDEALRRPDLCAGLSGHRQNRPFLRLAGGCGISALPPAARHHFPADGPRATAS